MLGKKQWVSALLALSLLSMGMAFSASADAGQENDFLAKINSSRSSAGLGSLKMSGSLSNYSRSHSAKMADSNSIYHSTSDQLRAAAGSGWSKLGENVGRGPTVSDLHTAFMNSSGHRKNILGDYDTVGIGTVNKDGYIYVTVVFVKYGSGSPPTTSPPKSTTTKPSGGTATTKPAPTTTTTTIPPTTTTTLIVPVDHEIIPGNECIATTRFWQMCSD